MKARTRTVLTSVGGVYILAVAVLFGRIPLHTFNRLLVGVSVPMVWLIWVFARWSANQHASKSERDIERAHGSKREHDRAGAR